MGVVRRFLRDGQTLPTLSIVDDGTLRINMIADDSSSYIGSGSTWNNLGTLGGSFNIGSGVTYDSATKAFRFSSATGAEINSFINPVSIFTTVQQEFSARSGPFFVDTIPAFTYEFWIYFNGALNDDNPGSQIFSITLGVYINFFKPSSSTNANGYFRFNHSTALDDTTAGVYSQIVREQNGVGIREPLDGWYHIVITDNNTTGSPNLETYVNGEFITGINSPYYMNGFYVNLNDFPFGFNFLDNDFYRLNTFRIYDKKLTPAEILQNYQATESNFSPKGIATADLLL